MKKRQIAFRLTTCICAQRPFFVPAGKNIDAHSAAACDTSSDAKSGASRTYILPTLTTDDGKTRPRIPLYSQGSAIKELNRSFPCSIIEQINPNRANRYVHGRNNSVSAVESFITWRSDKNLQGEATVWGSPVLIKF